MLRILCISLYVFTVLSSPHKLIVDTDMDIDDMWAIAYMLKNTHFSEYFSIQAITVGGDGWSDPVFGVPNALTLIEQLGCPNIPVAYGANTESAFLDPSGTGLGSVPINLKVGIDTYFTCMGGVTQNPFEALPSPYAAEDLIVDVILNSATPVDILLLGPWTNLARAISIDRSIVDNIGTLWVSGGSFDGRPIKTSSYPWVGSKTSGASWNIFSDPLAAERVLQTGLRTVMMTSEAQGYLGVNITAINNFAKTYEVSSFFVNLVTKLAPCTNQSESAIDYWDPSTSVLMYQLEAGLPTICTHWESVDAVVDLFNGGGFGRTFNYTGGDPSRICRNANITLFEIEYWSAMAALPVCPNNITKDYSKTPTVEYVEKQLNSTQNQLTALQEQVNAFNLTITALQAKVAALESQKRSVPSISFRNVIEGVDYIVILGITVVAMML